MKFQLDAALTGNVLSRVEPGCVWVNGTAHTESVIVPWAGAVEPWGVATFEDLSSEHFERLLAFKPELVLFSSGATLRFAHPRLTQHLMAAGVGVDCMDLHAACRTYNVLTAEGRKVIAALLLK